MSSSKTSAAVRIAELSQSKREILERLVKKQAQQAEQIKPFARQPVAGRYRVSASEAQRRLWFIDQLEGGGTAYHLPVLLRMRGVLDVVALQAALDGLVQRHEPLRTVFTVVDGMPVQEIATDGRFSLETSDLRPFGSMQRDAEVLAQVQASLGRPFDLRSGPLIRGRLFVLDRDEHVLLLAMHHTISDGWSLDILTRELGALYGAHCEGRSSALGVLPVQYGDYAQWQRERLAEKSLQTSLAYWKSQLQDAPEAIELPTDRPRPATQNYAGSIERIRFAPDLVADLRAFSREHNLTLAMVLFAAWTVLLSRLSGQKDIVVGMPVANRQRPELEGLVGLFVNTLAIRVRLEEDSSVGTFLQQTRQIMLGAYAHQSVPFEEVVKAVRPSRSLSFSPIFQAMFVMHSSDGGVKRWPGLSVTEEDAPTRTAHFDLTLSLRESPTGIVGGINYASNLFDEQTVQRWARCFQAVLRGMLEDTRAPVGHVSLMSDEERGQILESFNTVWPEQPHATRLVHEIFEAQARSTPDTLAVVHEGRTLTYAQLDACANQLAWHLRGKGVGPDDRVALCVERGLEMVIAILAILKAGGAYVPLDPVHPGERLSDMLHDSSAAALLIQPQLRQRVLAPDGCSIIPIDWTSWERSDWAGESSHGVRANGLTTSHLAYVIYTSGSTGKPKGVMVEHRNVLNFLQGLQRCIYATGARCSRIAWNSSFGFDMAVKAWGQLLTGRTVYLVPEAVRLSAEALVTFLEDHRIDAIEATPSHLRMMRDAGFPERRARSVRKVLLGGEAIDSATWRELAGFQGIEFFNMYGPTEGSVDASCGRIEGHAAHVGHVMPGARIYIVEPTLQPCPVGIRGEIYIGGAGVARGYLNRKELTAERFVADPFSADPDARMYRTGDLGRWRADGTIEYLGRNDHQVKVRGFRIELGEIEAQLMRHEWIKKAVVVAREDVSGDKRLVAYIVGNGSETATRTGELRAHLQDVLPEYMVPSAFVAMDRLPLNANGKLDQKALPVPDSAAYVNRAYEPPQGEIEEILAGIWQSLLRVEKVGRQDNFFALGGHSLLIVELMERLRRVGLATQVRRVFESSTLASLASSLIRDTPREAEASGGPLLNGSAEITADMLSFMDLEQAQIDRLVLAVPGGMSNVQDIYPLTPLQEGILFHHRLNERRGDLYVVPTLLTVSSRATVVQLTTALQAVIDRHEMLRTAIMWEHLPQAVQVVLRHATLPVEEITLDATRDASHLTAEWMKADSQTMDLRRAPLLRLRVAASPDSERCYVLLQLHHIVADATAAQILVSEVVAHFENRAADLPPPARYRNHVVQALTYARTSAADEFFRSKLGDVAEPTAPFSLLDVHGDGTQIEEAVEEIDPSLVRRLRAQARIAGVSSATLFHAAWGMVVAHTSCRDDVVFGSVLLGRLQGDAGSKRIVGMFINTLPLRLRLKDVDARQLLEQTHRELLELMSHEQATLAVAQRCSSIAGAAPLFTALLNYRHGMADAAVAWSDARGVEVIASRSASNYPISISVDDSEKAIKLTARTDRRIVPARVTGYLATALGSLVSALEKNAKTSVLALSILPDRERAQVLDLFNDTARDYPHDRLIHELVEQQAVSFPNEIAVTCGEQRITYRELNGRSNQLARVLVSRGIRPDDRVAVYLERSVELIIGLLATLKAGGAYVPLDTSYPVERLKHAVRDSAAMVLLTQRSLRAAGIAVGTAVEIFEMDARADEISGESRENIPAARTGVTPGHLAYVIYTSGSTGVPKGVAVEHRSVTNLISWHCAAFGVEAGWRCSSVASIGFDAAAWEIWPALSAGAALILAPPAAANGEGLLGWWSNQDLDIAFLPTPLAEVALAREIKPRLRVLLTGGDRLRLRPRPRAVRLINNYGPTEVTVLATSGMICAADPVLHIGRPVWNSRVYILDERRQIAPIGVAGEIYIAGAGVARGYLNRPELTAERFVADPFSPDPQARMYRTGDLGRWLEDGAIEFLGRNDHQVKIRGFRIELGEIESQLTSIDNVKQAVVVAKDSSAGDKRLVAYIVPAGVTSDAARAEELRTRLRAALPVYMVPDAFVFLDVLPLTPNGKVDLHALPVPDLRSSASAELEAPQGDVETSIAGIWTDLLQLGSVGRKENFFALGGNSLHGMRLIAGVEEALAVSLPVTAVFQCPTIEELGSLVRSMLVRREPALESVEFDFEEGVIQCSDPESR